MFSILHKTNDSFSVTFILLSAHAVNLDQSKIFLFGKELKVQLDETKSKAIAADISNIARMLGLFFDRVENIMENGENAGYLIWWLNFLFN